MRTVPCSTSLVVGRAGGVIHDLEARDETARNPHNCGQFDRLPKRACTGDSKTSVTVEMQYVILNKPLVALFFGCGGHHSAVAA